MHDVIDIAGSWFSKASAFPHLWTLVSPDRRFLAVVTQQGDALFRLQVFHRVSGAPQWRGTWWHELDRDSACDTLETAQQIAHAKFRTLLC